MKITTADTKNSRIAEIIAKQVDLEKITTIANTAKNFQAEKNHKSDQHI